MASGTKAFELSGRAIRTRAMAGTCGRICGFGWIFFWAMLQVDQTASINTHTTYSDFVPLGAAATGILLMTGFRALRQWIIWRDGIADEDEKEWEFETARIENDGHSLCCSFLKFQCLKTT